MKGEPMNSPSGEKSISSICQEFDVAGYSPGCLVQILFAGPPQTLYLIEVYKDGA